MTNRIYIVGGITKDSCWELGTNINSLSVNALSTYKNGFLYLNFQSKITGNITLVIFKFYSYKAFLHVSFNSVIWHAVIHFICDFYIGRASEDIFFQKKLSCLFHNNNFHSN